MQGFLQAGETRRKINAQYTILGRTERKRLYYMVQTLGERQISRTSSERFRDEKTENVDGPGNVAMMSVMEA